jgi:hypothetical protein
MLMHFICIIASKARLARALFWGNRGACGRTLPRTALNKRPKMRLRARLRRCEILLIARVCFQRSGVGAIGARNVAFRLIGKADPRRCGRYCAAALAVSGSMPRARL